MAQLEKRPNVGGVFFSVGTALILTMNAWSVARRLSRATNHSLPPPLPLLLHSSDALSRVAVSGGGDLRKWRNSFETVIHMPDIHYASGWISLPGCSSPLMRFAEYTTATASQVRRKPSVSRTDFVVIKGDRLPNMACNIISTPPSLSTRCLAVVGRFQTVGTPLPI